MASSGSSSTSSDGWKHAAVDRSGVVVFTVGPVATGSRRRRLVLRLSQKDALQALFQQNPYPGIATRERLARELGIAESRVQVWFQNQRRRRFKQSRSPPEHVHPEGEAGPTSTPAPPSRPPRPQPSSPGDSAREARRKRTVVSPSQTSILVQAFRRDRFPGIAAREELARQTGIPEPRIQGPRDAFAENGPAGAALGLTDQRPGGQAGCRMGAAQAPARYGFQNRRARHPQQSPSGPGGAAATTPPAPEDRRTPPSVQSTSPPLRPSPPQESMPPSAAPAAPFGAPAFWVPGTAPGVCVGQPLMIFLVQPSPVALRPSGKPPPPAQAAVPWAVSSPAGTALGQPGQGAILPPAQPEAHIPRWPGSPYGEGAAPPLEPQPQPRSLPSPTSLLDALLAAAGAALAGTPSLVEQISAATGIHATPGPSLGPCAGERAHLALPGSPSVQDALLASLGIPGSPGPFPGSSPVVAGAHPAFPGSPSLLEEILAATATRDTPWSPPGPPAWDEGVEATLEAPLSEEDYQALLDMLPGSPDGWKHAAVDRSGVVVFTVGPVATGSRRRRLVLRLSQKDALQALFQQNPYPGIATRERLARELGIAESRVQVWFQNQRRRRFKQSRSPPEHVHPEGEAGPTSTPAPPSRPPRPQPSSPGDSAREARRKRTVVSPSQTSILVQAFRRDRFPGIAAREELARQTGIPEPRIQGPRDAFAENGPAGAALGLTDQRPGGQAGCRMGAAQAPARYGFQNRRARHPQQSPSGPGGAAATTPPAPEDRRTPPSVQSTSPPLRPSPPQESMPPSAAPAAPFGAPAFWVPGTAPGVCVGQPLMIFLVQPSPVALRPSGKPPPPAQAAVPWAVSSPAGTALGQPGQGAILPPAQPEAHIPRWPGSPYGEGAAPPLEPQPQPRSLPSPTSLLDALLAAAGAALAGTPSLVEQISAATGIHATPGPSLGPCAGERAHLALPGSPSVQDALLASLGIPGSPGPFPGSSPVVAGAHPAFPGSPSLLEEILAATATRDTPWSPPGPPAWDEGVEATLEAPLSEEDYQALLDMLPGSPDGWKHAAVDRSGVVVFTVGPVATGSRRRRLVLRLSQKDALQALFQQNPYPGIATRERLARELGIAESRVQVWFQNQRRRRFKQSRSPPEHVHPEGEAGPTSTPAPPSRPPRPQPSSPGDSAREARRKRTVVSPSQTSILVQAFRRDRFPGIAAREELARQTGIPEPRIQGPRDAFAENGPAGAALGLTDQRPGGQAGCRMGAAQAPARYGFQNRRARHPQQSPSGPGGAAATTPPAPEDRRTPPSVQSTSPPLRPSPPQESMPPSAAPAAPFGAPAFWVPGTAPGVCVGQPLMIFLVQPSPVALRPSGKPPPPAQAAVPWAVSSPAGTALGQPGQGAILPPAQPEAHIPRWPGSPYGEGAAPPLEPQPQPRSLPSPTSLLDALLAAAGAALAGTPSLVEQISAATGIHATPGPSLGPCAGERAHLALPGSPSVQDALLASLGIPGSPGPFPGSSPVVAGAHPAFPGSPSLLEEILAATATRDTPWSPPGPPAWDEGVEATLEAPLSEEDYQALLDMLPGSPDGWKHAAVDRSGVVVFTVGPVATGSRRRRLVLRLSQKDALQALFQQNPYPGIATRERLARELGIAESRVQVWFQNQRRRRFKQSRSPPEHVHPEGEAGPTSTPAPPSRPPRPQPSSPGDSAREARRKRTVVSPSQTSILVQAFRRDRFPGIAAREELARQTGIPEPRIQGPRDAFAENGPAGAALGLTDQRPGGQAGCRMGAAQAPARYGFQNRRARHPQQSPSGPGGAAATTPPAPEDRRTPPSVQSTSPPFAPPPPQESMPPSAAPAAPFGAPAFWVPGTAPGVCVGQPLMIFLVQPSPVALRPSGKPPPPAQAAVPWAVSSPAGTALGQPGQGAILPPAQPEAHIPRWPGSPYGEGAAPPLEPQPQPRSLPSPTSLLDALLAAAGAHPASKTRSWPPLGIPGSPGPFPGSSPVVAGAHPAFPGSPSLLEEILAATATRDTPWSPRGPLRGTRG
ncbi:proline-rich protein 36-like [Ovis aries]|uniref:proline-rich protein 36-like n=1 Tax=Ovis aries TaxID=9940 RepID=UPI0029525F80|nr:proline-rich protein 36-like [Ovis aries]